MNNYIVQKCFGFTSCTSKVISPTVYWGMLNENIHLFTSSSPPTHTHTLITVINTDHSAHTRTHTEGRVRVMCASIQESIGYTGSADVKQSVIRQEDRRGGGGVSRVYI